MHVGRGAIYQARGNLDQAIADFGEAVELDPKFVDAYLPGALVVMVVISLYESFIFGSICGYTRVGRTGSAPSTSRGSK